MFKRQVVDKSIVHGLRIALIITILFLSFTYMWFAYGLIALRIAVGVVSAIVILSIMYIAVFCKPSD